jgi:hypothetical protein
MKQHNYLFRLVHFLRSHPLLNLAVVLLYAFGIIFFHDPLVQHSVWLMSKTGIPGYNTWVTIVSVGFVILLLSYLQSAARKDYDQFKKKVPFLLIVLIITLFHYRYLLEMNIEIIHALAYGIGFIPLIALVKNPLNALVFALPFMLFDEWYQYQVLYPHYVQYWELNDVVLNILGGLLMISILDISHVNMTFSTQKIHLQPATIVFLSLLLLFVIAFLGNWMVMTPLDSKEHSVFIVNKLQQAKQWWHVHPLTGKTYLILGPISTLFAIICFIGLLVGVYGVKEDASKPETKAKG